MSKKSRASGSCSSCVWARFAGRRSGHDVDQAAAHHDDLAWVAPLQVLPHPLAGQGTRPGLAVVQARKVRLQQMADTGDRGARTALRLSEDPNRFLGTIQSDQKLTVTATPLGALSEALLAALYPAALRTPAVGASLFGPALLGVSTASAAPARRSLPAQTTKAPTRVSLLTMGPGDHPFARFGHTALLLEWGDHTRVYNFGTFFFDGLQGVKDFMAGRFRYWLSVSDLQRTLAHYQAEERSLIAQDLDLTRKQALQLARLLEENATLAARVAAAVLRASRDAPELESAL